MTDSLDQGRLASGSLAATPHSKPHQWSSEDENPRCKPLTLKEAQALRARHPSVSPWVVLKVQALVGLILSAGVGLWQINAGWSALYGVATVVMPGVVMARGMSRQNGKTPAEALLGFMVWEFAKVMLAVALLVAAVKVVPGLNWLVLLLTLIVSLKVNWLVLLWHRPSTQKPEEIQQHVR